LSTQNLTNIVDVSVQVNPATSTLNKTLNLGLIVGTSTVIPDTSRVVEYTSTSDMLEKGWQGTEPEYKAAQIYFSQIPAPSSVAIGRQDTGASPAETAVQAVTACRQANSDWYAVYVCDTVAADIEAIAAYIETCSPVSTYFYETSDSAVIAGTAGNVMATLQTNKYTRTFGQYSTSAHAAAAAMGYAMGANTGQVNSAYTLAYKTEAGITPETLTSTQVSTILGYNGNVYTNYGDAYNLLVQGAVANGTSFDEIINQDILTNNIQTAILNALIGGTKIPQTTDGVNLLINAITKPCSDAKDMGIIAPGVWNGPSVLGLKTGDTLSTGYLILADTIANQSQADRDARKSPPIYVCVKFAGAIEHMVIGVMVNQ
jgi:hypothetical protein